MGEITEVDTTEITQGDHLLKRVRRVAAEWLPEDPGAVAFRDMVVEELERILNGFPDYDTGYFYVENGGNTYVLKHGFGKTPSKARMYFNSSTPTPQKGSYTVTELSPYAINSGGVGIELIHDPDGTKSAVYTRATTLYWNNTSGYLRVMLWR